MRFVLLCALALSVMPLTDYLVDRWPPVLEGMPQSQVDRPETVWWSKSCVPRRSGN